MREDKFANLYRNTHTSFSPKNTHPRFRSPSYLSIQDCTFPAHRVVLSCCSRWLRSLLSDTSQETVNLDELDPAAFEVVLGYLYGEPLIFTPELSEEVVRVVRTFEMEDLEVRIWKYLIRSVTTKNCVWLHQLADAYDCPALKYEAWRVIKVVLEDYENQPEYIIKEPLLDGLPEGEINEDGEEKKENDDGENFDEDDESSDDEEGGRVSMLRKAAQSRVDESYLQNPDNVIPGQNKSKKPMTAKNVVMDWADRLQTFYEKCEPTLTTENQGAIALLKGRLPLSFYRDRLFAFYEEHNPEKLETIDDILEQWAGKEDELLKAITDKYKAAKEMADHLATYNELEHTLHNEEKEEEEEDQFER